MSKIMLQKAPKYPNRRLILWLEWFRFCSLISFSPISDIEMYIAPNMAQDKAISTPSIKYTMLPEITNENPAIRCSFSIEMKYFLFFIA